LRHYPGADGRISSSWGLAIDSVDVGRIAIRAVRPAGKSLNLSPGDKCVKLGALAPVAQLDRATDF
jgi:hypothetical protein